MRHALASLLMSAGLAVAVACSAPPSSGEPVARVSSADTVGGCTCAATGNCDALTFSNVPADDTYYVTTFGGGSDTQPMACGGMADGTWAYVADEARFGCGAKLLISANGKRCVAQVSDCGPNRCVEQAAANDGCSGNFPIIDASPFITEYLLGEKSAGWSDHTKITATLVPSSTVVGCPGGAIASSDSGADDSGERQDAEAGRPGPEGGAAEGSTDEGGTSGTGDDGGSTSEGEAGTSSGGGAVASGGGASGADAGAGTFPDPSPFGSSSGSSCALGPAASRDGDRPGLLAGIGLIALFRRRRRRGR